MPTADRVLSNQIVQHNTSFVHDTRRGVTVLTTFWQVREVVEGGFRVRLVAEHAGGHLELAVTGQGTEVQRAVSVVANGREGESEDTLFTPLEVQTGHVEVAAKGIGEEETVLEAPRFVLHPRVDDESVTQLVGHVGEGVITAGTNVNGDVGDESVRVGILWAEFVTANACVCVQVEDIDGVGTDVAGGVADAQGAGVEDPQATAFVSLDAVDGVQADGTRFGSV